VVLRQSARSAEPAKGALDHPPTRLDSEALLPLGGSDDFNPDALLGGARGERLPCICAVGPDQLETRLKRTQSLQQASGSGLVGNMGAGDLVRQDKSLSVDEQLPLAALHAFAAVVAPHTACLGRAHTLAVHDAR
jgi:hypothetical protein